MVLGPSPLAQGGVGKGRRDVIVIPYHRFEIISSLKPGAAIDVISAKTQPGRWFRLSWPTPPVDDRFEGHVEGDCFHIRRIIGYGNAFLPVVKGVVHGEEYGARIVVTMRPFVLVIIFMAAWLAMVGSALFSNLWPLSILMLIFAYVLIMSGFWFEASKQERILRATFDPD
jgi:hypothetical protein